MQSSTSAQQQISPCSFAGCTDKQITRRWEKTGWAILCRHHCELKWQQEADAFVAKLGLKTTEEKITWVKEKLAAMANRKPNKDWAYKILADPNASWIQIEYANRAIRTEPRRLERIPGEDDE